MTTGVGSQYHAIQLGEKLTDKMKYSTALHAGGYSHIALEAQKEENALRARVTTGDPKLRSVQARNNFDGAKRAVDTLYGDVNTPGSIENLRSTLQGKITAQTDAEKALQTAEKELANAEKELAQAKKKTARQNAQRKVNEKKVAWESADTAAANARTAAAEARTALDDATKLQNQFFAGRNNAEGLAKVKEARQELVRAAAAKLGKTEEEAAEYLQKGVKRYREAVLAIDKDRRALIAQYGEAGVPIDKKEAIRTRFEKLHKKYAAEREFMALERRIAEGANGALGKGGANAMDDLGKQLDGKADDVVDNKGLWKWCGENKGKAAAIGLGLAGIAALGVYACRRGKDEE